MSDALFLILSVERTRESLVCVWWAPDARGYTSSLGEAGRYTLEQVRMHADPPYHVAIPLSAIEVPRSLLGKLLKKASPVSRFGPRCAVSGCGFEAVRGHAVCSEHRGEP